MIGIFDIGIIGIAIYTTYNVLLDKSKDRDNRIKMGVILLFLLIILKFVIR